MLDRHGRRIELSDRRRNLLGAVMAMPMDALAVPFLDGSLVASSGVCRGIGYGRGDRGELRVRLAGGRVHRTAEHDTQQQQQSRDVGDVSKTEPKKHAGRSNTVGFTIRHPIL
jgi:hypothetical protein